ncbi:MAG: STAS domain-containing protein [Candidatus Omnitrophota bacterium]
MELFAVRLENNITIIQPNCKLDVANLKEFSSVLDRVIEEGAIKVLLNFANVDYLSSTGIRVLVDNSKKLKSKKGSLSFCSVRSQMKELFEIVGLHKVFPFYVDEEDALKKIK